jgi:adenylate cyclase
MPDQTTGCVLFADVSGSTKLYETVGDAKAHAAIDRCIKLFTSVTQANAGRVIKTIGDEVMAEFPQATNGAAAAKAIQQGVSDMEPLDNVRLGVRVGFHDGPVVHRDNDVFGDTVNLAARLTELASRGQIITSFETVERLTQLQKMDCRKLYSIPVKGREQEVVICELMWADTDDATQVAAMRPATSTSAIRKLRLVCRDRVLEIGPGGKRSGVLGRDATADLTVADKMASRAHCEVELRQDKFFVVDRSANGTFLTNDGDNEMVLRREEALLRGHGYIALGQSRTTATELVEFFSE